MEGIREKMDIFELIKIDHRKVEELFSQIEGTKDSKKLDQYFKQIYSELNLHSQVEELTFYPTMRDHEGTEELLEEAEQEHTEVKVLLEQMKSLEPGSSEFKAKIKELKEAVEHHVQEEENEVFPKVRQCMSDEELKQLAAEFQEVKNRLQHERTLIPS
jgi:hemerythrin superfamily protein